MCLVETAGASDTVLTEHEAVVFLGPVARQRLTGQTLNAHTREAGSAFYLRD